MVTETEAPAATVNMELVNEVFDHIEAERSRWSQSLWTTDAGKNGEMCGTTFCFGGWALYLKERVQVMPDSRYIFAIDENGERTTYSHAATELLGFNEALAHSIFYNMETDWPTFKAYVLARIERMGHWTPSQVKEWMDSDED